MGIIVDLIIIAVVLLFIFLGYKKGLTGSLIKLLSFIIAIVVAFVLYKPVANAVIENTVIDDNIRTTLSATLGVEDKTDYSIFQLLFPGACGKSDLSYQKQRLLRF